MIRRYRHSGWDVFASVLLLVCVAVASTVLLLEANGYLIDFDRLRIEPSSLLVLKTAPKDTAITLDGVPLANRWETTWQIAPGRHELMVESPGRHTWRQSFHVLPRHAAVYQTIILYAREPRLVERRPVRESDRTAPLVDEGLRIAGSEVRQHSGPQVRLITRFSRPVLGARWLDDDHLVLQLGSELHVIDIDGTNDRLLLTLPDSSSQPLLVSDGGQRLGIVEGETVAFYELY